MRIVKASAGSGKTYTLAGTYLDLLLKSPDPYAYRHILAVTFTNKATAEMKNRILRDLGKLAETNPKARKILTGILHDYSAFSVSTIDKFFQTALKAFSREIGQFSDYQLELDRKSLVTEAIDRILDSLSENNPTLLEWIKSSVKGKIEAGEKYNFDKSLYDIGQKLKSEEFREIIESSGTDTDSEFDKRRLTAIHGTCRRIISDFLAKAETFGIKPGKDGKIKIPAKKDLNADAGLAELFGTPYDIFNTAVIIDDSTYSLGLAGEFLNEFNALLKEKNLMCLEESNTILRKIIDGSDAPFIYEKLGVRYEHFMLDEFQDTSNIQWENFLPLLKESDANGNENLIVGDVKQSIYRWRDSDWNLLRTRVPEEFPEKEPESLDCNWRSCGAIVDFNNTFFKYAADILGVSDIYSDVGQHKKTKDSQDGFVRVSFTDDQDELVLASIESARDAGARWGDIAVLVRNNRDGSHIASKLIDHGTPVISDDSLRVKSSVTVRRLVSLLSSFDNPDDSIGRYLSSTLEIVWPDRFFSIEDLCEELLRQLETHEPDTFAGETLFIQAFMDDLKSWTEVNGNNLSLYLQHWEDNDPCIGSPDNSESVRILTVHKSKGLEFPYLIFPYAEKVGLYKHGDHWCRLNNGGPASVLNGIYPVTLSSGSTRTLFADDYEKERRMQVVDNINVFYVALTRAAKCLHIIAANPSKTFREKKAPEYKTLSEILFHFNGSCSERTYGRMYDFSRMEREDSGDVRDFPATFRSIPLGGRLQPSTDAMDFFGEDGLTGPSASPRIEGIILHNILSEVNNPAELRAAVDGAVLCGALSEKDGESAYSLLSERISAHGEWFHPDESTDISNETTILGDDGECHRPDRVITTPDGVTVIDYKFGEPRRSHLSQVRTYMDLYHKMGAKNVRGAVWYVREDKICHID